MGWRSLTLSLTVADLGGPPVGSPEAAGQVLPMFTPGESPTPLCGVWFSLPAPVLQRRGNVKICCTSLSVDSTLPVNGPFQLRWVLGARDTLLNLLLWKISKMYKSREDSHLVNPQGPITQVHQGLLHGHFGFVCPPKLFPQIIFKPVLDICVLCLQRLSRPGSVSWERSLGVLTSCQAASLLSSLSQHPTPLLEECLLPPGLGLRRSLWLKSVAFSAFPASGLGLRFLESAKSVNICSSASQASKM